MTKLDDRILHAATPLFRRYPSLWRFCARDAIVVLFAGALALRWLLPADDWAMRVALPVAFCYAVTLMLQSIISRGRPSHRTYRLFLETHSFPSAHAALSGCLATLIIGNTMMAVTTPLVVALAIAVCLVAVAVACGRVAVGVHYPTDVLVGGALGVAVGCIAVFVV